MYLSMYNILRNLDLWLYIDTPYEGQYAPSTFLAKFAKSQIKHVEFYSTYEFTH